MIQLNDPLITFKLANDGTIIFAFLDNGQEVELNLTDPGLVNGFAQNVLDAATALHIYHTESFEDACDFVAQRVVEDSGEGALEELKLTDDDFDALLGGTDD